MYKVWKLVTLTLKNTNQKGYTKETELMVLEKQKEKSCRKFTNFWTMSEMHSPEIYFNLHFAEQKEKRKLMTLKTVDKKT